jgi:hypothetical protein
LVRDISTSFGVVVLLTTVPTQLNGSNLYAAL